jgi:hypothetical protein
MAGGPAPTGPSASPLGQAWGYGIVLGVGFLFAIGMVKPLDEHHSKQSVDRFPGLHYVGAQAIQS